MAAAALETRDRKLSAADMAHRAARQKTLYSSMTAVADTLTVETLASLKSADASLAVKETMMEHNRVLIETMMCAAQRHDAKARRHKIVSAVMLLSSPPFPLPPTLFSSYGARGRFPSSTWSRFHSASAAKCKTSSAGRPWEKGLI